MKFRIYKGKKQREYFRVIGILSGTSVDGIDVVSIKIFDKHKIFKIVVEDSYTYYIPSKIRKAILKNSDVKIAKIDEICRLNVIVGNLFADAITKFCKRNHFKKKNIDIIGSHGQTIHHLPKLKHYLGYKIKSTMQIGDPSVIANLTGIITAGDFRIADCSLGGDGAPLVPYLDYKLFTHKKSNRILLNIGGISNLTVLPANCNKDEVTAFDTGPGNMLMDLLAQKYFLKPYDTDSKIASKGKVHNGLLSFLCSDSYLFQKPPKSTGREYYGENFLKILEKKFKLVSSEDKMRTVLEFTTYSIHFNYSKYIRTKIHIDEMLVSGGGAKNPLLLSRLKSYFRGVRIKKINQYGITVDNKEAVLFALLAYECMKNRSANMPSVTGSKGNVILGKICPVIENTGYSLKKLN